MKYEGCARKVISKHRKRLSDQVAGVYTCDDIECIHAMRVATRRLQNAFWIFKDLFPPKKLKRWRKSLRSVLKRLGEARDLDIQITFLEEYQNQLQDKKVQEGIDELIAIMRSEREQLQPRVREAVHAFETAETLKKIKKEVTKFMAQAEDDTASGLMFNGMVETRILGRLQTLFSYEPFVYHPRREKELHKMRIAAKKLRYTLENLEPLYGAYLKHYIESARSVQKKLGILHDFDVWIGVLPQFEKYSDSKTFIHALHHLRNYCKEKRKDTYNEFVTLWETLKNEKVWSSLLSDISPHAQKKDT